jgi:hypothetical protein
MDESPAREFSAPAGSALRWISVVATLILMGVSAGVAFFSRVPGPFQIVVASMGPVIAGTAALFVVRGYRIEGRSIVVRRLLWNTRLPLDRSVVAEVRPGVMNRSIRIAGNGGLYSFTGWFHTKELGRYRAFVTDLNRTVVVRIGSTCWVFSPDDPGEFAKAVCASGTA